VPLHQHEDHAIGQSVGAPNVNSLPIYNNMLRIVNAVQQFMTEYNGAMSEEERIVVITKIVLKTHGAK
jgi:glutamate mutase epsilon subunit